VVGLYFDHFSLHYISSSFHPKSRVVVPVKKSQLVDIMGSYHTCSAGFIYIKRLHRDL
jgi:hypothetical protein